MPLWSTDHIRQAYLDFFSRRHGHAVIPGASLIPENDPTVLFTTAGMHPLVPYLLGEKHPAGKRLTDVQRCVRTQDIDEVGDANHLTMFEMLGNWSLGDYFKEGAIAMSLEFLTEVLEIPVYRLAVTCFEGDGDAPRDDESAGIWMKMGIPKARIGFLPKAKNWWGPAGKTGPCGPDTEMFCWIGEGEPKGNPESLEADWLEIWNDVFMQYNKQESGAFEQLKQKCVDTGMGLERVSAVMQGAKSVYETDCMLPMMEAVNELVKSSSSGEADKSNLESDRRHARIITDHVKAATFMLADGVRPSNVDRGYVLRRLIRRAVRSGKRLNIGGAFLAGIAKVVIDQYAAAYPHIPKQSCDILDALKQEETQFGKTLQEGLKRFSHVAEKLSGTVIGGLSAFHLYDTYGFPLELTKELARERALTVDEAGFKLAFEEHQNLSRAGAEKRFAGGLADHSSETTKLHTATHLLNAALRMTLGDHVRQKGSNITAERLRFDFTHPDKMTPEQIMKVERLVNEAIKSDLPVAYHLTTVEGARAEGAVGVFDERYDNEVKVYVVGDPVSGNVFSSEICGGPHVARTGMIGSFKIQKEESSSSGVRRIRAVIGGGDGNIAVAGESS